MRNPPLDFAKADIRIGRKLSAAQVKTFCRKQGWGKRQRRLARPDSLHAEVPEQAVLAETTISESIDTTAGSLQQSASNINQTATNDSQIQEDPRNCQVPRVEDLPSARTSKNVGLLIDPSSLDTGNCVACEDEHQAAVALRSSLVLQPGDECKRLAFIERLSRQLQMSVHESCTQSIVRYCKLLVQAFTELDQLTGKEAQLECDLSSLSFLFLTGRPGMTARGYFGSIAWAFTKQEVESLRNGLAEWCWTTFEINITAFWDIVARLVWAAARVETVLNDSIFPGCSFRQRIIDGIDSLLNSERTLQLVDESVSYWKSCNSDDAALITALTDSIRPFFNVRSVSQRMTSSGVLPTEPRPRVFKLGLEKLKKSRKAGDDPLRSDHPHLTDAVQNAVRPEATPLLPNRDSVSTTTSSIRARLIQSCRLSWTSISSYGDLPSKIMRSSQFSESSLKLFLRDSISSGHTLSDIPMEEAEEIEVTHDAGKMDNDVIRVDSEIHVVWEDQLESNIDDFDEGQEEAYDEYEESGPNATDQKQLGMAIKCPTHLSRVGDDEYSEPMDISEG